MILQPAVFALLCGSLVSFLMTSTAAWCGFRIIKGWDLNSGEEGQLLLEKKTYLVSTLMAYTCGFLIVSLLLFIYTAENLHPLFVGAMCAAGTLNVNLFGYPALILKVLNCLLAGIWIIINYADNRGFDYPLIRQKYIMLLVISPLFFAETVVQTLYFINLKANVITSCCGSLFSPDAAGVAPALASLPIRPSMITFFSLMAVTLASGAHFALTGRHSGHLYAIAATVSLPVSIAALIVFISCYFYELPTHHCPFCILQPEYGYAGYFVFISIMGGSISGAGVGVLMPYRAVGSLRQVIPRLQRRLAAAGTALYCVLTLLVFYQVVFSDFKLIGY